MSVYPLARAGAGSKKGTNKETSAKGVRGVVSRPKTTHKVGPKFSLDSLETEKY